MATPAAGPPARPVVRLGWGWWAQVALVVLGGVLVVAGGPLLAGGLLVAGGFVLAAVLRLALPGDRIGGLGIRGPRQDVVVNLAMAAAVAVATFLVHAREMS